MHRSNEGSMSIDVPTPAQGISAMGNSLSHQRDDGLKSSRQEAASVNGFEDSGIRGNEQPLLQTGSNLEGVTLALDATWRRKIGTRWASDLRPASEEGRGRPAP